MEYLWPIIVASFWGPMLLHFKKSNEILEKFKSRLGCLLWKGGKIWIWNLTWIKFGLNLKVCIKSTFFSKYILFGGDWCRRICSLSIQPNRDATFHGASNSLLFSHLVLLPGLFTFFTLAGVLCHNLVKLFWIEHSFNLSTQAFTWIFSQDFSLTFMITCKVEIV